MSHRNLTEIAADMHLQNSENKANNATSKSDIEYKACSDYIANACICVDNCTHKELVNNKELVSNKELLGNKEKPNLIIRKVPVIDTSVIAKENTIHPSLFHHAINVYNSQNQKDFQNAKNEKFNLNGKCPINKIVKLVCLDNTGLRIVKSTPKNVASIEAPAQVSAAQNINNNPDTSTSVLKNKSITVEDSVNLEENDQLESLLSNIDGVTDFKSVKSENYLMEGVFDTFPCFSDAIQDDVQFSNYTHNIKLPQEQSAESNEQLRENDENLVMGCNTAESIIKEDRDQLSQDDSFNTSHYVRRSSRKRKQIDILDLDGSDEEIWQSKRKSKGKERQRRKYDYDNIEYIPGRSFGRVNKNHIVNQKRSGRYYDSNNFLYTAEPNYSSNCNYSFSTGTIFSNSYCKNCVINKWNEVMMKDLLQADVTSKQKLLENLRQRLLGNIPGYRRPEGWLSQIMHRYPAP